MQEKKQTKSVIKKYGCGCFITTILLLVMLGFIFPMFFASIFLYFYMGLFLPFFVDTSTHLETENMTLIETHICDQQWYRDYFDQTGVVYNDPRLACFATEKNETELIRDDLPQKIILPSDKKFLVFAIHERFRREGPRKGLRNTVRIECYQIIHEESVKADHAEAKFLGSIDTNRYYNVGGWEHRVSISSDGKYVVIPLSGKNSRDLERKHQKNYLLTIWEIGENTEIRPITDSQGNDIPVTIIEPSEELEI